MIFAPQDTEAGRLLRSMGRGTYRVLSRLERIAARESAKAMSDMMVWGTGFVVVDQGGVRHVPSAKMFGHNE